MSTKDFKKQKTRSHERLVTEIAKAHPNPDPFQIEAQYLRRLTVMCLRGKQQGIWKIALDFADGPRTGEETVFSQLFGSLTAKLSDDQLPGTD